MRIPKSRLSKLWYSLLIGVEEEQDEYGNYLGRRHPVYASPVEAEMLVSPSKDGTTTLTETGLQYNDTRSIITNDMVIPFDSTTVLWIDIAPFDENGRRVPHNYVVDSVQRSLFAVGIK